MVKDMEGDRIDIWKIAPIKNFCERLYVISKSLKFDPSTNSIKIFKIPPVIELSLPLPAPVAATPVADKRTQKT